MKTNSIAPAPTSTFRKVLQHYRHLLGLTQQEFAKQASVSLGSIREYERDQQEPKAATIGHLARTLGIAPMTLLNALMVSFDPAGQGCAVVAESIRTTLAKAARTSANVTGRQLHDLDKSVQALQGYVTSGEVDKFADHFREVYPVMLCALGATANVQSRLDVRRLETKLWLSVTTVLRLVNQIGDATSAAYLALLLAASLNDDQLASCVKVEISHLKPLGGGWLDPRVAKAVATEMWRWSHL